MVKYMLFLEIEIISIRALKFKFLEIICHYKQYDTMYSHVYIYIYIYIYMHTLAAKYYQDNFYETCGDTLWTLWTLFSIVGFSFHRANFQYQRQMFLGRPEMTILLHIGLNTYLTTYSNTGLNTYFLRSFVYNIISCIKFESIFYIH